MDVLRRAGPLNDEKLGAVIDLHVRVKYRLATWPLPSEETFAEAVEFMKHAIHVHSLDVAALAELRRWRCAFYHGHRVAGVRPGHRAELLMMCK